MDAGTITAISGGVVAGVAILALLYNVIPRRSDSAPTPTNQGDNRTSDGLQTTAPSTISALNQLPPPPADFTGRNDELAELEDQMQQGGVAISGVRGMGGVGKTALALELARHLTPKFPDAQFYLDLKGTSPQPLTPAEAMAHVIRAYNREARIPESEGELQGLYHSALNGQRALLLMDNALDADQIRPLIPPQGCVMLVTSRQRFDLPGLHALDLDMLTSEDARELLIRIAPRIGDEAGEIAQRCSYLPLALRLAAGALNERANLTPEDYLRRLEDAQTRLELVDSSLSLSYDLLPPELQESWATLSVFTGSFDLHAAEGLWGLEHGPAQDRLGQLISYSLVEYNPETHRYRLHDLARLLASSRLDVAQKFEAQLRHARHFANVLAFLDSLYLEGGNSMMHGLEFFDEDWSNIQTGQAWAQANSLEDDAAGHLCNIFPYAAFILALRLNPHVYIRWLEAALEVSIRLQDRRAESAHLGNLGVASGKIGEPRLSISYFERSLEIARELGDRQNQGNVLGNLGNAYGDLGQLERSVEYFRRHLEIALEIGDRRGEGSALGNLGVAYVSLGEPHGAIEYSERYLELARATGDLSGAAKALGNLGRAYKAIGDTSLAIEFYKRDLEISVEIGDIWSQQSALGNLGNAYSSLGEEGQATECYLKVLDLARDMGDVRSKANALWNMASLFDDVGDRIQAIAHAEATLTIFEKIEDPSAAMVRDMLEQWLREADEIAG